jgi:hypothetical protein
MIDYEDFEWHWYADDEAPKRAPKKFQPKKFRPDWLKYFKRGNEHMLRAMTPAQRRKLLAKMMEDYNAHVAKL